MSFEGATKRTLPPFRFDTVGSFLRTEAIKEAREKFQTGNLSRRAFTKIEEDEILKLVNKQKEIGLEVVTDGEFRRHWWMDDFFIGFDGIAHTYTEKGIPFHDIETTHEGIKIIGKVLFNPNHPFFDHFKYLKSIAGNLVAKQTIPAPAQLINFFHFPDKQKEIEKIYPNIEDFFNDVTVAYQRTILAFYGIGCRNIQLDDCTWGINSDPKWQKLLTDQGIDLNQILLRNLKCNNEAIADLPKDLIITSHVCRGNYRSSWGSEGGYEPVSETFLAQENVSAFFLEYDTDRAGGFEPLASIPKDKLVVLGLFTSKFAKLEDKQEIIDRITEATKYVSIDRICLSPQCGFASTEEGNNLTEAEQWDKLIYIKSIVDEIWK